MFVKSLIVEKTVQKKLNKLPIHIHKKCITILDKIQTNPLIGIKLHGELSDYYKIWF